MDEKSNTQRAFEGLLGLPAFLAVAALYHGWKKSPEGFDFWGKVGASFGHSLSVLEREAGGIFLIIPLVFWIFCLLYLIFVVILKFFDRLFVPPE